MLVFILDNTFSWKLCYSVVHIKLYSTWKKNFVALGQASKNLIYAQLQLKISLFILQIRWELTPAPGPPV